MVVTIAIYILELMLSIIYSFGKLRGIKGKKLHIAQLQRLSVWILLSARTTQGPFRSTTPKDASLDSLQYKTRRDQAQELGSS